jgi:hypothetical protein
MARRSKTRIDSADGTVSLLKKLLMLELFKLGVSQPAIAKKLTMQTAVVNAFLKGIKKRQ